MIENLKKAGYALIGILGLCVVWKVIGVFAWISTLPVTIGLRLIEYTVGLSIAAVALYASGVYISNKFVKLFS